LFGFVKLLNVLIFFYVLTGWVEATALSHAIVYCDSDDTDYLSSSVSGRNTTEQAG
jgi:hypothetical protein